MTESNVVLEVNRSDIATTRLVEESPGSLAPGQVRLRIDRFALTANNITYATFGDMLGYWGFFPASDGWGRVPAMGWADVIESANPEIEEGGRYYGWYPMARLVDVQAAATAVGIRDDGAHRLEHAPVYRTLLDTETDPWYEAGGDAEDRHALLRGLFLTGFLADEFFAEAEYFGARSAIVLSASSKTAIGFAGRACLRDDLDTVIGVTSSANEAFVRDLEIYDEVVSYHTLSVSGGLTEDDSVCIDMAGDQTVLARVHALLGDRLKYSMIIGNSHHDGAPAEVVGGPTPQMFFAPTEVSRQIDQWGRDGFDERVSAALADFVEASRRWLRIERSTGAEAAETAYAAVYAGEVPPSVGRIVSLHET